MEAKLRPDVAVIVSATLVGPRPDTQAAARRAPFAVPLPDAYNAVGGRPLDARPEAARRRHMARLQGGQAPLGPVHPRRKGNIGAAAQGPIAVLGHARLGREPAVTVEADTAATRPGLLDMDRASPTVVVVLKTFSDGRHALVARLAFDGELRFVGLAAVARLSVVGVGTPFPRQVVGRPVAALVRNKVAAPSYTSLDLTDVLVA